MNRKGFHGRRNNKGRFASPYPPFVQFLYSFWVFIQWFFIFLLILYFIFSFIYIVLLRNEISMLNLNIKNCSFWIE